MTTAQHGAQPGFRHEALLYAGAADFVARAAPIIARAMNAGEPVLVAIDPAKIQLLREELGHASDQVTWKDIRGIGGNPARIIPLWRQFVGRHASRPHLWGFGEPIWAERAPAELIEAQRHEQLLNLAFAGVDNFTLLCPYDTSCLDDGVLSEAEHSHPHVETGRGQVGSGSYRGLDAIAAPFDVPLPEPAVAVAEIVLDPPSPARLRRFLADHAHGLDAARVDRLSIGASATATTMGRPGAPIRLRLWDEPTRVVAELGGLPAVKDPLAGREWPSPAQGGSRGLWLANQLCDLVQLRSGSGGAVVRLHVRR